jgi:CRP-like cAMP-binding protein
VRGGTEVARLEPGHAFGELGLLGDAARTATVRALRDARVLRVGRDQFQRALDRSPEMGLGLLRTLSRWLRAA